jgi:hypothetical protein
MFPAVNWNEREGRDVRMEGFAEAKEIFFYARRMSDV